MTKELEMRPYTVIEGRNTQRALGGGLDENRASREFILMDTILGQEQLNLDSMGLIQEPLSDVEVNPNLTIFLDGVDGRGGYADVYARTEWQEPGTRIEMEQEKQIMRDHLLQVLNPEYLEHLRQDGVPLVIIEGGAGPDLRTFGNICDVLVEKAHELQGIPIQMVHVDISKRMAAITAAKARRSAYPEKLAELGLQAEIAVCHADVFDLLSKVPPEALTYALLPFGVLSFGLDGKNPSEVVTNVGHTLRKGGGLLATVYNTAWRDYTEVLEQTVNIINVTNGNKDLLEVTDLNPFVIRILNGEMQVGGGLAFNCTTFTPEELVELVNSGGVSVDSCSVTPQGWAYWPESLLNAVVQGKVFPNGLPILPPGHLMDRAKSLVLSTIEKRCGVNSELIERLEEVIPDGKHIINSPAPYITVTAVK